LYSCAYVSDQNRLISGTNLRMIGFAYLISRGSIARTGAVDAKRATRTTAQEQSTENLCLTLPPGNYILLEEKIHEMREAFKH
jgi:hypothetical protein